MSVEAELRRRGWQRSASPAGARLLVVCGTVGDLDEAVTEVWGEMPDPKARGDLADPAAARKTLDGARAQLAEPGHVPPSPHQRAGAPGGSGAHHGMVHQDGNHDTAHDGGDHMGHQGDPHTAHQGDPHTAHQGDPHTAHHGMSDDGDDMAGGGGMEMPAGLAMAERTEDRDGLKLDQLHLTLGPLLSEWPTGLVLRVAVQGDVIQQARAETVGGTGDGSFWDEPSERARRGEPVTGGEVARRTAGHRLDSLGRLLEVAGWPAAAGSARWLRDDLLGGLPAALAAPRLGRLVRHVGRSRVLSQMTAGLGQASDGDVRARYRRWLDDAVRAVASLNGPESPGVVRASFARPGMPPGAVLETIEQLVVGTELGVARLVVASIDPDLDDPRIAARHG
ncbi:MAG: hypothetical protein ACYDEA_00065 [Candidatus Dormibacteria bacterium]